MRGAFSRPQIPNFLVEFITPIIKATKGKQRIVFHTMPECVRCACACCCAAAALLLRCCVCADARFWSMQVRDVEGVARRRHGLDHQVLQGTRFSRIRSVALCCIHAVMHPR